MTPYQVAQLQQAALDVVLIIGLLSYLLFIRRGAVPPVAALGVLIGVIGACSFVVSCLVADRDLSPMIQVAVKLLRDLPAVLVVCYTCLMQSQHYSLVVNKDRLRSWFSRAVYVIGAGFLVGGGVELVVRPPVLESDKNLPAWILVSDAAVLAPLALYAALASYVFFGTLWRNAVAFGLGPVVQNACGVVALGGMSLLALHTFVWRGLRIFLPEEQIGVVMERMSANQVVMVGVVAVSITVGLVSYSGRGRSGELAHRFLSFLRLVGDPAQRLADATPWSEKLNLPYEAMRQAADENFLDLSSPDRHKADMLFRGVMASRRQTDCGYGEQCIDRKQLTLLDKFGEEGVASSCKLLSGEAGGQDLYEVLSVLHYIESQDGWIELRAPAEWMQLAFVALADAGLVSCGEEGAIVENRTISGEVADAYWLAKYEIENRGLPKRLRQ